MASLTITTRKTRSGPRYVVRYRLGGRAYPIEHGGSFRTRRAATERKNLIGGEIAAGRNPRDLLEAIANPSEQPARRTFRQWADAYGTSRVDIGEATRKAMRSSLLRLNATFGDEDPATITAAGIQEWVGANADLKPTSIRQYLSTLRQVLDHAGVEPNPARERAHPATASGEGDR